MKVTIPLWLGIKTSHPLYQKEIAPPDIAVPWLLEHAQCF